jgi:hypothetical protein
MKRSRSGACVRATTQIAAGGVPVSSAVRTSATTVRSSSIAVPHGWIAGAGPSRSETYPRTSA